MGKIFSRNSKALKSILNGFRDLPVIRQEQLKYLCASLTHILEMKERELFPEGENEDSHVLGRIRALSLVVHKQDIVISEILEHRNLLRQRLESGFYHGFPKFSN